MNWSKDIVQWTWADTLCLSVVFTWQLDRARWLAKQHKGPVRAGGPAVGMMPEKLADVADIETPLEIEALPLHNPFACRTSVGCPRHCEFCINRDKALALLPDFTPRPLVCDDNFLATPVGHQETAIEKLARLPYVDFNQGLDARLFDDATAARLARLRHVRTRFSWDTPGQEMPVRNAINRARAHGLKDIRVYVLIGFPADYDTPEYCRHRCEELRALGIDKPNVQRFQPVRVAPEMGIEERHLLVKNSYVPPAWTEAELRRAAKYWNRQAWLGGVRYEDFRPPKEQPLFR